MKKVEVLNLVSRLSGMLDRDEPKITFRELATALLRPEVIGFEDVNYQVVELEESLMDMSDEQVRREVWRDMRRFYPDLRLMRRPGSKGSGSRRKEERPVLEDIEI